ncbi:ligase-associated DNA damage response DEXH box helicase [Hyphococcus flavus]|uniref:Ligase-associated DNA damage response DEXH box helicase n=1 Tax=Hyphococcus flavus TaxID=1866326 RepID=A0AAE9ZBA3_9PROT|nr:ligase-associated DNA damage response DEXH box helicase [Hyphococcus flavus]WDI31464.1 ligase-associated DNA damage response DEXH box helicase [Hyphococcus flavus]
MSAHAKPRTKALPVQFEQWFASRGWEARAHQLECLAADEAGHSFLLIAPTGGGKTLAGFLPSLVELAEAKNTGTGQLHTLYISPLKALAVDVARNVETPVREMGLDISIETRTGDTPPARRQRQKYKPPDILMTTPESLSILIASPDAREFFKGLKRVVLDELHALIPNKRGHLLSLALARLRKLAPDVRMAGLSATVPDAKPLIDYLTPQNVSGTRSAKLIRGRSGAKPQVDILMSEERIPWSGHTGRHSFQEVYEKIRQSNLTLVFVNTRSQAEITFASLWKLNDENLPIALHHGSLEVDRRRKVEAAMTRGDLRAVVCTSTLDLGIDWGDVDLVIQMGAPKGASRLTQRIGRANHRMNEPSRALLAPANRMEVLECIAAKQAIEEGALDGDPPRKGTLDVLAQHILGMACAEPFDADELFSEIRAASPYADLPRKDFDDAVAFVATGGYALKRYERYRRIVKTAEGKYRARDKLAIQQYKMNVGTITTAAEINIRLAGRAGPKRPGRKLGTIEEWFFETINVGDAFYFAGEVLRLERIEGNDAVVSRTTSESPKLPSWGGNKYPWSTYLADRVRRMLYDTKSWKAYPDQVRDWLEKQREVALIPKPDELLVETFPYKKRYFLVCYPFEGWLAHQTLGMLVTRRLERLGKQPIGFVPTEYALSVWSRQDMSDVDMPALFDEDMLGDDLEEWTADAIVMKRTFRNCATIAGLIEKKYPGQEKTGRQVSFSADLIYDVLREHEPDHLLLRAAWDDASGGFMDVGRLQAMLTRAKGRVVSSPLDRVSPLAVPVMLEIGRETVAKSASEEMLKAASDDVIAAAMGK